MSRKQLPDLDSLESPLISANPFGSILPGSALAERIFNDPDSWQEAEDDDGDLKDLDVMKWLADEVGKYQANGEELILSPLDRDVDIMLKFLPEKLNFAAPIGSEKSEKWDNYAQKNQPPLQPRFDHTSLDARLNVDLRFSKIWDTKGKILPSLRSPVSFANESKALPLTAENAQLAAPPALDLDPLDNALSPIISPLTVSASTTWSILELYGVRPNSPRVPLVTHYPPTPYHTNPPALSSLPEPSFSSNATVAPPSTPLPQKIAPPMPESTPIRRLPVIPDPAGRNTPSPTPLRTLTPSRGATPQRSKSPNRTPEYVKNPECSGSVTSTPNGCTTKPYGQTLPVPSSSPDPLNSYSVTSIRSSNLLARSPPAGPRPRESTNPTGQRRGRDSPSSIVIEPAPVSMHTRKLSPPPPGLYLGVPA